MKKTPLTRISDKRKAILAQESIATQILLEQYKGKCMVCGKEPDFRGLQKSHTRDRKRFILVCASCHSPNNEHKYLEEKDVKKNIG